MKTARELLLQQHRHVEPKLDRIRASALRSLSTVDGQANNRRRSVGQRVLAFVQSAGFELVWRPKRVWIGFAAAWAALLFLNAIDAQHARDTARRATSVPRDVLFAWEQGHPSLANVETEPIHRGQPRPRTGGPRAQFRRTPMFG